MAADAPRKRTINQKKSKYRNNLQGLEPYSRALDNTRQARLYQKKRFPYMGLLWYPASIRDDMRNAGPFIGGAWRGLLHTTEGSSYIGARSVYQSKSVAPHFTVSFENQRFQVWQHIPINRAARALKNLSGGVETNRIHCIQIEIVGRAGQSHLFPEGYLKGIGRLMRWIEANTEIKPSALPFYGANDGIVLARTNSLIRLQGRDWLEFNGWCGHQHAPENEHWDPGKIDINYLLSVDIGVKPMYDPPIPIQMVDSHNDPENGGTWVLDANGGVITTGTARFWGTPFGKDYWGSRRAARIRLPSEIPDYPQNTHYKYIVTATSGENYGFPE